MAYSKNSIMSGLDADSLRQVLFTGMHPTRREILALLVAMGRARFTQLAESTGYDPVMQCGSFYYHLSKLEEMGMVGREKEAYIPTAKGRKTNELMNEAISPGKEDIAQDEISGEKMGVVKEDIRGGIEIREFIEEDIPLWVKAAERSKMLRNLLEPKTQNQKEFLQTTKNLWEEDARRLVHGTQTNIRPTYVRLLSTSKESPKVEGEERFSFGAFTEKSIVGLVVGVIARQRSMGALPLPGLKKKKTKRKKPDLFTFEWVTV